MEKGHHGNAQKPQPIQLIDTLHSMNYFIQGGDPGRRMIKNTSGLNRQAKPV
jgi:hypothetical protein